MIAGLAGRRPLSAAIKSPLPGFHAPGQADELYLRTFRFYSNDAEKCSLRIGNSMRGCLELRFNPFDLIKVRSNADSPLSDAGKLVLDYCPENNFSY